MEHEVFHMASVMLRKDWGSVFRRTIKDALTKLPVSYIEFHPGEPLEVDADQLESLQADIAKGTLKLISFPETAPGTVIAETSPSSPTKMSRRR